MSGFSKDKEARLLELLSQELEIFERMRELTGKHAELIAEDEVDALGESLDRRQELIEKINGLHQESNALMQSYMSYSNSAGGKSIGEIEKAAGRIRDIIAECAGLDEKNTEAAKEKVEQYKVRANKLSLNRKSMGAYIQGVANNPEMFDKMT